MCRVYISDPNHIRCRGLVNMCRVYISDPNHTRLGQCLNIFQNIVTWRKKKEKGHHPKTVTAKGSKKIWSKDYLEQRDG